MPKYGKIENGELQVSNTMLQGYKPIEYAEIPETFDQTTHYVVQSNPIDKGDYIFVDIEINDLPEDLNEGDNNDENIF